MVVWMELLLEACLRNPDYIHYVDDMLPPESFYEGCNYQVRGQDHVCHPDPYSNYGEDVWH
mgnify:CR=1 FL=1